MGNVKYNPLTNEFRVTDHERLAVLPQVMWHITDRCPLSCPYCFATKTGEDFAIENLHETLAVLRLLGVQKLDIAGGEPLVCPHLPEVIEAAVQAGFALTITTSGAGLDANREWLVSHAQLFSRVIVSIDGATKALHDELRGKIGTFEQAADLVSRIQHTNACVLRLNTVVVRRTLESGAAKSLTELASSLRPAEWCLIQPHPANKKQFFESHSITSSQFRSFVEEVRAILDRENLSVGRLIYRTASEYSGYWVLYPNGMLRRHTDGPQDGPEFPLTRETVSAIRSAIAGLGVTIPLEVSSMEGQPKSQSPTRIENKSQSFFGSELLRITSEIAQSPAAGQVRVSSIPVQGEKGEIITGIAIGVASHIAFDLLKAAARRLASHPGYDDFIQLNINGQDVRLKDIVDETRE